MSCYVMFIVQQNAGPYNSLRGSSPLVIKDILKHISNTILSGNTFG